MKSCSYCINPNHKPIELIEKEGATAVLDLFVRETQLRGSYDAYSIDSSFDGFTSINYCPMCGRKLGE